MSAQSIPETPLKNVSKSRLVLYYHQHSSFSQKVLLALHEKGLEYDHRIVDLFKGDNFQAWFYKLNPKGQIPVLQDGDKIIPDSAAIIRHLEENYSNEKHPRLEPEKGLPEFQKMQAFVDMMDGIRFQVLSFGTLALPEFTQGCVVSEDERTVRLQYVPRTVNLLRQLLEKETNSEMREYLENKIKYCNDSVAKFTEYETVKNEINKTDNIIETIEQELASKVEGEGWLVCEQFTTADVHLAFLLVRVQQLGLGHRLLDPAKRPMLLRYKERLQKRRAFREFLKVITLPSAE